MSELFFGTLKLMTELVLGILTILALVLMAVFVFLFFWIRKTKNSPSHNVTTNRTVNDLLPNNRENIDAKQLVAPGGLSIIASSGPERKNLPPSTNQITLCDLSHKTHKYKCGHVGSKEFHINAYGTKYNPPPKRVMCPECTLTMFNKHVIRCALCGHSITPQDPVAMYEYQEKSMISTATVIDGYALGCLRWDCCPSGGFMSGHWSEQGFKPYRFNSVACT